MKKNVFIVVTFLALSSCKWGIKNASVWTPEYEMKLTRQINADISARLPDNAKRQKLVSFIIKRLKEELPQGVESVSKDSLNIISSKIGMEYGYSNGNNTSTGLVPKLVPWSRKIEKSLHDVSLKDATDANRNENELLYDCVIKD